MYDTEYISTLLDKYWNGDSSAEEERLLKRYFSDPDMVHQDLLYALPYFEAIEPLPEAVDQDRVQSDAFDNRILDMIALQSSPTPPAAKHFRLFRISSIAASVLLVAGVASYWLWHFRTPVQPSWAAIHTLSLPPMSMPSLPQPVTPADSPRSAAARFRKRIVQRNNPHSMALAASKIQRPPTSESTPIPVNLLSGTYTDPAEARQYLDSVLALVSEKYNQGIEMALSSSRELQILNNPLNILHKKQ